MRFTPQFLDELRARLPVSEVVGRRVKLRKQGREFIGLSPFNKEKSPSFTVNDQKGFFHDFSSGKHGDIFGFVMETEGVAFPEAVERLAQLAGVPLPFDRFRDRVMFPITDLRGRVVAFGGRALEKDAQAKYLNSPETPLFHKGATLYNIAAARQAAHDGAPVIAVEGYVDVIAMVTAGFAATVAPLGTALTEDQLTLLWKMADEPVLCFDGDNAGLRAAYRAVELAMPRLKPGKSLKFALLPQGQDPDDLVRSAGREAVMEVIAAARPLADMLWARETEGHTFATPERRAALEARINEVTSGIADDSVRKYYRQDFNARLSQFFAPAQAPRGNFQRGQRQNYGQNYGP